MRGIISIPCSGCGTRLSFGGIRDATTEATLAYHEFASLAHVKAICTECRTSSTLTLPIILVHGDHADAILCLPAPPAVPGGLLVPLFEDLETWATEHSMGDVRVYPNFDHYALDHSEPDIYHGVSISEVLGRNIAQEETYIQDIADDLLQAGDPMAALDYCCAVLEALPDLSVSPGFIDNLALLIAACRIRCVDQALFEHSEEFIATTVRDHRSPWTTLSWRVPYGFDTNGPKLDGVPVGYLVPSTYVDGNDEQGSDDMLYAYFMLVRASSSVMYHPKLQNDWRKLRHSMLLDYFERYWKAGSQAARNDIAERYLRSSGRTLTTDLPTLT